ncbi:MAG: VWA domain-containing protein [Phycisphaerales bacterium]
MNGAAIATLGAAAWRFGSPAALLLLLALPFAVGLIGFGFVRARRGLKIFAGSTLQETKPGAARAATKLVLTAVGLAALMLAVARPQADPVEESVSVRGRDVLFIVDVSRSMLSRDAVPNRLSRAKLWINDLVNTLQSDRVGLIAFAGAAVVKCPLTMDYGFFRMSLDELSPASVPRGGTLIGDAIRKAMTDVFEPGRGRYRDIILITDGEDQGSFPAEAAKQAAEQGVRLIVIGIGSEVEGAPVPSDEKNDRKYVEYEGERVRSRLDQTTLSAIAQAASRAAGDSGGGGVFLNVGTGTMNLDTVYHDLAGSADQRETETKSNVLYRELFPYFLLIAGACLALEPIIGGRIRIRRSASASLLLPKSRATVAGTVAIALFASVPARAEPAARDAAPPAKAAAPEPVPISADASYNAGRELFLAGKYSEAAERFRSADIVSSDPELSARARFNLGQSLLKDATSKPGGKETLEQIKSRLEGAAKAFRSTLDVKPDDADAARNVEIARRILQDFEQQQEEQKKQQQKDKQQKDGDSKDKDQNQDQKQDQPQGDKQNQDESGKEGDSKSGKESEQHQQNSDKLKDLAKQQEQAADQTKKASEQKSDAQKQKEQQQAKADQEKVNQETQKEQQKQQSEKSAGEQAKEKLNEAGKQQKAASEALNKGDEETAEEHQRKAAELLNDAAQAEQQAAEEAKQGEGKDQEKNVKPKDDKPKYNETASQLLDKERKERDARQQVLRALRGKPVPVEKDW